MSGRMKAIGSMVEFGTIKPRECGGEKAEVEMVFNGQLIAALGVERTDFVLDFFESAFDFPSCGKNSIICSGVSSRVVVTSGNVKVAI